MQRLGRSYIVVPHESVKLLDLLRGDFDGVVQHRPDDAFRTGWSGKGPGITIVGTPIR